MISRALRGSAVAVAVLAGMAQGQGQPPKPPVQPPAKSSAPAQAPVMQPQGQAVPGRQPVPGQHAIPGQPTRPRRRSLDIRAQAPAPEVVTIRPREVPEFSRALLAPAIYRPPATANATNASDEGRGTVVIYPGTLPIGPAATIVRPPNPKPPDE